MNATTGIAHAQLVRTHPAGADRVVVVRDGGANRVVRRHVGELPTEHGRKRWLTHEYLGHGDTVAQHGQIMSVLVGEVAVIDRRRRRWIGADDVNSAAAERGHAGHFDVDAAVQQARLVRGAHREHVKVEEPIGGLRRNRLAQRLFLR